MYAIVDIETTGGRPDRDKITEIAIIIHDGNQVVDTFSSLINPECYIPYYISKLTGITDDMVHDAPKFYDIAKHIVQLTQDCIFVAHNVNFDYGFVKASFKNLGYDYNRKTLCTVKLSRKTFLGLPSYSLGKLCDSLGIGNNARHRALGDAQATAIVFDKILQTRPDLLSDVNLKSEIKKNAIPVELNEDIIHAIPEKITGVYYFHNIQGQVIYVGKSIDIKKRVLQHFATSAKGNRRSLQLRNEVADISYENTGSELIALLLESDEIKKLKPKFNIDQKKTRAIPYYGIYTKVDHQGYLNLYVDRWTDDAEPIFAADSRAETTDFLHYIIKKHQLCLSKCDIHKTGGACFYQQINTCHGACVSKENAESYNLRAEQALTVFSFQSKSFFMVCQGRTAYEKSIICIEKGQYKGFGYADATFQLSIDDMRNAIKYYPHNQDIQTIIRRFESKNMTKITYQP